MFPGPGVGARNIRLTAEYDGSRYAGWQRQLNALGVQQVLEEALEKHLRHPVRVSAAGRTDTGVHALGQVVNFFTTSSMAPRGIERGLLPFLPRDMAVRDACEVPDDFDARRSARLRWYRFFLSNRSSRPALAGEYLTHVAGRLDIDRMREAAETLTGTHNFQAFRAATCTATRTVLDMQPIGLTYLQEDSLIVLDFRCRSFLHNMVRILTGTIVACGRHKLTAKDVEEMLATGKRRQEAVTVPPSGLVLYKVLYPGDPGVPP